MKQILDSTLMFKPHIVAGAVTFMLNNDFIYSNLPDTSLCFFLFFVPSYFLLASASSSTTMSFMAWMNWMTLINCFKKQIGAHITSHHQRKWARQET